MALNPAAQLAQQKLGQQWAPWLAKLDEVQKAILVKYQILDGSNGLPAISNISNPKYEPPPKVPGQKKAPPLPPIDANGQPRKIPINKIGLQSAKKLVGADMTKNHKWLDWILFQAGGGSEGKRQSVKLMEMVEHRFKDDKVTGEGINPDEVEAMWLRYKYMVKDVVEVGDEETIKQMNSFAYTRAWSPRYEDVYKAVSRYLPIYKKALEMNKYVGRESPGGQKATQVSTEPDQINTPQEMEAVIKEVEHFFGSETARQDFRIDQAKPIYDDDIITAIAPLTYAAAVKYGFDDWAWAKRADFEAALKDKDDRGRNFWTTSTESGIVYVYLTFNVPVPAWVNREELEHYGTRVKGEDKRYNLTNLALVLKKSELLNLHIDSLLLHDEENNEDRTVTDIKQMILSEPGRPEEGLEAEETEEFPILRGGRTIKTPEEAENIAKHFELCLQAVINWAKTFDPAQIKTRPKELAKPKPVPAQDLA